MAGLTLIPNSSQESFHSSHSQQNTSSPHGPHPPPPQSSSNAHAAAHATGLRLYDADVFLNDSKNQVPPHAKAWKGTATSQPVQLGTPKTNHHVSTLNQLCQKRGMLPEYEIEGDQFGFGGRLKIGKETISRDERWPSKKEAREALAETGLEVIKGMQEVEKAPVAGAQTNWVGLLQMFHDREGGGPVYTEYAIGVGFGCTCTIPLYPGSFGSASECFPTKKAARANAAEEAMKYLIQTGLTNPDGSVKSKQKAKLDTVVRVEDRKLEVKRDATYAQKVNDLCPILGLQPPTYQLSPSSDFAPNLLSGAAFFSGEPRFPGRYGEVRNIFGKKAAKEESARGVWQILKQLAVERGVNVEVEDD
ncbi:hypothetical protein MMC07_007250 [Pseudocyphellaria aurata]|nr:hypothetical protein [Pseudocyphellaria aurata]